MEQGWFYAEDERSVGPLSFDALAGALRRMPQPGQILVWRTGFEDWRPARDIPELADRILDRAPSVPMPDPRLDRWSSNDTPSDSWADDGLPETSKRRWPYMAAFAVVAAVVAGGVIYASRTPLMTAEPEGRVLLPAPSSPEQPKQEAAKPDPATALAQLTETAAQAEAATEALAQKLWAAIEPPTMQPPDYTTASRGDLENHVRALQTAEANVTDAQARYVALLKAERDLIAESAQSSALGESAVAEFLSRIDDRQSTSLELMNQMLQARANLYGAVQGMQAIAIEQFGKYKAGPEGIRFSNKAADSRFAAAGARVNEANRQLDLIEERILRARQPQQQPGWQDMMTRTPELPVAPRQ